MTLKFPAWMKKKVPYSENVRIVRDMLQELQLNTVCQGARCPNIAECFARKTATFMILGHTCTRNCTFCAVNKGAPVPVDPEEPARMADAVARMGLKHVVITSVTRDDLADGGAEQFARTVKALRRVTPDTVIEVLIPDFAGDRAALTKVVAAKPHIINHNLETVPRLYPEVRPMARYGRSLELLRGVKELDSGIYTKSGLMAGLGETAPEILAVMDDLLAVDCDILTIGQYLRPTEKHIAMHEFVTPETFALYKEKGLAKGFKFVASGPFIRSSYHAEEFSRLFLEDKGKDYIPGGESDGS